jgi:hypothetical protein
MTRASLLACGLAIAAPALAPAQDHGPGVPGDRITWRRGIVHYGKWVALAGAVGLTALAVREHNASTREWDQLLAVCRTRSSDCATGSDGRYLNYPAELHYEKAIYYDHRARRRLIGGQLSLLTAAVLFLADLHPGRGPGNIPFNPLQVGRTPSGDGVNVGVRFAF